MKITQVLWWKVEDDRIVIFQQTIPLIPLNVHNKNMRNGFMMSLRTKIYRKPMNLKQVSISLPIYLVTKSDDCQAAMSIVCTMCFQLTVCFYISTNSVLLSPWISTETLWIWGMFPAVWVIKESVFALTV